MGKASFSFLAVALTACGQSPHGDAVSLCSPVLPAMLSGYSDADAPIPAHFRNSTAGTVLFSDNTPAENPITNPGATLGRVLFYDVRLSADNRVSCASCHRQAFGFSDTTRFSPGVHGIRTRRRVMALANARFNADGRFFWDERAGALELQVLELLQDTGEMGIRPEALELRLDSTSYYPPLFSAAFGSPQATRDRVGAALAQFIRALRSDRSPFDALFQRAGPPDESVLSPQQLEGWRLFQETGCINCHRTIALFADQASNTGLDSLVGDTGAGQGRFKPPSLRNIGVRPPYMHDGRFRTLREVVDFYARGVQASPFVDRRLLESDGSARRLALSPAQAGALVAFLHALTDSTFLTTERFSDPFPCRSQ